LILTSKFLQNSRLPLTTLQLNLIRYTSTIIIRKLQLYKVADGTEELGSNNKETVTDSCLLQTETSCSTSTGANNMAERLQRHLATYVDGKDITGRQTDNSTFDIEDIVSKEIEYFRATSNKGEILQRLFMILNSIPACSVDAEGAFSACGLFCTKIRSRLNDSTLDTLCFLRKHFQNT